MAAPLVTSERSRNFYIFIAHRSPERQKFWVTRVPPQPTCDIFKTPFTRSTAVPTRHISRRRNPADYPAISRRTSPARRGGLAVSKETTSASLRFFLDRADCSLIYRLDIFFRTDSVEYTSLPSPHGYTVNCLSNYERPSHLRACENVKVLSVHSSPVEAYRRGITRVFDQHTKYIIIEIKCKHS